MVEEMQRRWGGWSNRGGATEASGPGKHIRGCTAGARQQGLGRRGGREGDEGGGGRYTWADSASGSASGQGWGSDSELQGDL